MYVSVFTYVNIYVCFYVSVHMYKTFSAKLICVDKTGRQRVSKVSMEFVMQNDSKQNVACIQLCFHVVRLPYLILSTIFHPIFCM